MSDILDLVVLFYLVVLYKLLLYLFVLLLKLYMAVLVIIWVLHKYKQENINIIYLDIIIYHFYILLSQICYYVVLLYLNGHI